MNNELNPQALKNLRKQRRWTQPRLAEKAQCSKEQISRWERGQSLRLRSDSLAKLAAALNVDAAKLMRPTGDAKNEVDQAKIRRHAAGVEDESLSSLFSIQLNVRVSRETRNALELVSSRYGVKWSDIIDIAPLLFFITAEKCLEQRHEALMSLWGKLDDARELAQEAAPHLAGALIYDEGAFWLENQSIDNREIGYVANDHGVHEPLMRYLNGLASNLPEKLRVEVKSPSFLDLPRYEFPDALIRQACGISEDQPELPQILRQVRNGLLELREIRRKRQDLSEADFAAWIQSEDDRLQVEDDSFGL